ncbi:MAG: Uma2 family endonuclease [Campylobacterota bacterium]|nr:Uma2 family endonuclease [Campylobacterota bacterium]
MGALKHEYLPNYTYDDYKLWQGDWELIGGIPYAMSPSPVKDHQLIANMFAFELTKEILDSPNCLVASELDWKIDDSTTVRPDVVMLCSELNEKYITKAPQVIIEVISPLTAQRDEKIKFEIYENEKVPYYIIAYPDDLKAKLYKLKDGKYDKQGDMTEEKYTIEDLHCKVEIDFDNIFKRFRK